MAGKDLDALAKGLADESISRGQALRRIVGALLGGVLAATPAAAFAAPPTWCFDSYATVCCDPEGQPFPGGIQTCGGGEFSSRETCVRRRQIYPEEFTASKCYPTSRL